ncbi:MAG: type I-U CRISPR-associated protein Csx17 [Pirellulaceae bacterium]|nr:type I-U CRISPR-associated protein Csx17 [Pirellulaceae bacterium]
MNRRLSVIPFNGLNADCLGNYLAALGLLAAVSQHWNKVRACWRSERFLILSDDSSADLVAIKSFLQKGWQPTTYERWWGNIQKADTKAKSSTGIWRERSERSVAEVRLLDAHVVGTGRNRFNPVLGTGGNVGKRDLAKAFKDATKLLEKPESGQWLDAALNGTLDASLPDLNNGGTWFVYANKTFNSGQSWFREGQMSPWLQLLATEGAFLLVGGVNRRLGSRARPYAAFPFVSEPSQPETDGEIGMSRAEFWAPLWAFPATITEVRCLFQRGLAKLGGRPAQAPHEFAVAAMDAGVDSGISEFVRFEFRQTTSSQVYEAIPRQRIQAATIAGSPTFGIVHQSASPLLVQLIENGWMDRLPFEPRDSKQRGKFVGLRGPVEAAIVQLAERPEDAERWQQLLLRLASVQARMDRSKSLRERCTPLPPLPPAWFGHAWPTLPPEIAIARSIASVGWQFGNSPIPMLANIFGVTLTARAGKWRSSLPATRPAQAVWGTGDPLQMLLEVAQRRLIDAEGLPRSPLAGTRFVSATLIQRFLSKHGDLDFEEITKWIPPLSLIDWSQPTREATGNAHADEPLRAGDGTAMLHTVVRPLFHADKELNLSVEDGVPLFRSDQLPKANLLRRLFQLLRFGAIDETIQIVRDRYLAVGRAIVMPPNGLVADSERVAAALLMPMSNRDVTNGLKRWLQPSRNR